VDVKDKRKRTVTRGKNHAAKKVQASQGDVDNVSTEEKRMKRDSVVLVTGHWSSLLPRKEVIQPHVLVRLPCYDFTPLAEVTLGALKRATSGTPHSVGVTGGVYNP
jgi:glycine/D-amino acid oxidase-like deaminating enzyme